MQKLFHDLLNMLFVLQWRGRGGEQRGGKVVFPPLTSCEMYKIMTITCVTSYLSFILFYYTWDLTTLILESCASLLLVLFLQPFTACKQSMHNPQQNPTAAMYCVANQSVVNLMDLQDRLWKIYVIMVLKDQDCFSCHVTLQDQRLIWWRCPLNVSQKAAKIQHDLLHYHCCSS